MAQAQRERASAYPTPVPLPREKTTKEASGFPSIVATYSRDAEAYANNVLWGYDEANDDGTNDDKAARYHEQDDDASELSFDLHSFASNASSSQRSHSAPPSSPSVALMRMPASPYELSLAAIAVQPLSRFFESNDADSDAEPASNPRPRRRKTRPLKRRLRPLNYIGAGR